MSAPNSSTNAPPSYTEARKAPKLDASAADEIIASAQLPDLPPGWIKQFDASSGHFFFVDTKATPPRSIWHHPLVDDDFLAANPQYAQQAEALRAASQPRPSMDDQSTIGSDEEHEASAPVKGSTKGMPSTTAATTSKAGASSSKPPPTGIKKLGRAMKDKMTNSTHEERKAKRAARAERERQAIERQRAIHAALQRAWETGQPQLVGKDRNGRDIFAQPPMPQVYGARPTLGYTPWQDPSMYRSAYGAPGGPYRGGMGMGAPILMGAGTGLLLGGLLF